MWVLRSSAASPFGRKVNIGAALCGLSDRITIEPTNPNNAADPLPMHNPLGKVPALTLDDGTALYDSRVILEWLDHQAGGGAIIPMGGEERFHALTLQATADGIMDANVLIVNENRRPAEMRFQPWLDRQEEKVQRALQLLEEDPPKLLGKPHIGHISLACALGHRDFRFNGGWREDYPRLVEWLGGFEAAVPSYVATQPN